MKTITLHAALALTLPACTTAEAGSFYGAGGGGGGAAISQAAYASCSGTASGDTCWPTDSPLVRIYDGSAFDDCFPGFGCADPIPTAGWTAEGVAHTTSTAGGVRVYTAAAAAAVGGHSRSLATTSSRAEVVVSHLVRDTSTSGGSVLAFLEEGGTADALGMQYTVDSNGNWFVYAVRRPNGTTNSSGQAIVVTGSPFTYSGGPLWMALEYDAADTGAEIDLQLSADGLVWHTLLTEAVGTSFAGAPDEWVLGCEGASTVASECSVYLFSEAAP